MNHEFDLESFINEGLSTLERFPYDSVEWHVNGADFPSEMPADRARTHIAYYLAWAAEKDLLSNDFVGKNSLLIRELKQHKLSPSDFFGRVANDQLIQEYFNDIGNAFTKCYYRPGWAHYYHQDYMNTLDAQALSPYHIPESSDNYALICAVISMRYDEWSHRDH